MFCFKKQKKLRKKWSQNNSSVLMHTNFQLNLCCGFTTFVKLNLFSLLLFEPFFCFPQSSAFCTIEQCQNTTKGIK